MMREFRQKSETILGQIGFSCRVPLPLIDQDSRLRSNPTEIHQRCLAMHAVAACAFGFEKELARRWLADNGLATSLTSGESDYLFSDLETTPIQYHEFYYYPDAIYVFLWLLGLQRGELPPKFLSDDMIYCLPDIKIAESADGFLRLPIVVSEAEILQSLDFHYCYDWHLTEYELKLSSRPKLKRELRDHVVWHQQIKFRRHALEWVLSDDEWDDVSLDT